MIQFTIEQVNEVKAILTKCDDEELLELFGEVYDFVKLKLAEIRQRQCQPYQFRQNFPDIT